MTLHIDFGPKVETKLLAIARQNGIASSEVVKKIVTGDLPRLVPENEVSGRNAAAIMLLRSWRNEDATDNPDEIRQAEEELAEFKRNINTNRAESGDHPDDL